MLDSLFTTTSASIDLIDILLCTLVSLFTGIIIAYTHMKTTKYNKNFLITLVILPVLVQTVMIMVNGNLGTSVAIAGAFSLVRFRSIAGTSKEILSIFFAMVIGIVTGMGYILFAILITLIVALVIIAFSKISIFDDNGKERILRVTIPENLDYTNMFNEIFDKYTKNVSLEKVKTTDLGSLFDLSYKLVLKEDINEKEFIDEIRVKNGNLKVILGHELDEKEI